MNLDPGWGWERKEIQSANLFKTSVHPNQPYLLAALVFFSVALSHHLQNCLFYYLSSLLSASPTKNVRAMKIRTYLLYSLWYFQDPKQSLAW